MNTESPASDTITSDKLYEERPLTPLSRCIPVGLPAETMETAAATFTETAFHDSDELLGIIALMHAKVYCFAHRFLISRLEELSLQRLTQVLLTCDTPSDPFFSRLADAIRLIYESTPNATQLDDPARKLLSQYVALNYTTLPNESLSQLVSEGGEFMIDVAQKLAQRIAANSGTTKSLEEQINELKAKINVIEKDVQEWESWNRRIPGKHRRGRRKSMPSEAATLEWDISPN